MLLVSGLVAVGLGGCFLAGVLGLIRPGLFVGGPGNAGVVVKPVPPSPEERALLLTPYGCASASLLGAVVLLSLGVRPLWAVLWGEGREGEG